MGPPGSCVLMLRISKDFGDHVLPLSGGRGYARASTSPGWGHFEWSDIFPMMELLGREMAERGRQPGWTFGLIGAYIATILYLPATSAMSRQWAGIGYPDGFVGSVGDMNITDSGRESMT